MVLNILDKPLTNTLGITQHQLDKSFTLICLMTSIFILFVVAFGSGVVIVDYIFSHEINWLYLQVVIFVGLLMSLAYGMFNQDNI